MIHGITPLGDALTAELEEIFAEAGSYPSLASLHIPADLHQVCKKQAEVGLVWETGRGEGGVPVAGRLPRLPPASQETFRLQLCLDQGGLLCKTFPDQAQIEIKLKSTVSGIPQPHVSFFLSC